MRKGQMTKEQIIRQSAGLFNTKGYAGTSLSEIIERTNIRKGGIYNHFESKDDIALSAFDYMFSHLKMILAEAMLKYSQPIDKLFALCDVYIKLIEENMLEGGCPILNTAVENDDGHLLLKQRAQNAMDELMKSLGEIIKDGIKQKQLRSEIEIDTACSVIIATIEGGVMLSKLFNDSKYIRHCTAQVKYYIQKELAV